MLKLDVQRRKRAAGHLIKHSIRQKQICPLIPVISLFMLFILKIKKGDAYRNDRSKPMKQMKTKCLIREFQHVDVYKSKALNPEAI